jgi:signal peptidase I
MFVMGDNRSNSKDSRYFGPVPLDSVLGHAVFRFWPLDKLGGLP